MQLDEVVLNLAIAGLLIALYATYLTTQRLTIHAQFSRYNVGTVSGLTLR